jgi:hypothetical protein
MKTIAAPRQIALVTRTACRAVRGQYACGVGRSAAPALIAMDQISPVRYEARECVFYDCQGFSPTLLRSRVPWGDCTS